MGSLRASSLLLGLAAVFLAGLWIVHSLLPILYPQVLRGPFVVERIEEAEAYAGYSPLTPFYRPQKLGAQPVSITVTRRPEAKVVVFWQGASFLYLSQELDGRHATARGDRGTFPGHPDVTHWREGATHHLELRRGDLWIEMRTDLKEEEIARVLDTLRPVRELL